MDNLTLTALILAGFSALITIIFLIRGASDEVKIMEFEERMDALENRLDKNQKNERRQYK